MTQHRPVVPISQDPARRRGAFASASVAAHLARGALGFGTIALAVVLAVAVTPAALAIAPLGMVALRGCPTCWTVGLIETISAGRIERACAEDSCSLRPSSGLQAPLSPR
jgi:hypothetical protein